jgi:hypothetical protein
MCGFSGALSAALEPRISSGDPKPIHFLLKFQSIRMGSDAAFTQSAKHHNAANRKGDDGGQGGDHHERATPV